MTNNQINSTLNAAMHEANSNYAVECCISQELITQDEGVVVRVTVDPTSGSAVYCIKEEVFDRLTACPFTRHTGKFEYLLLRDLSEQQQYKILQAGQEGLIEATQNHRFQQSRFLSEAVENMMQKKVIEAVILRESYLKNLILIGKEFDSCTLISCNCTGSNFEDSVIEWSKFERLVCIEVNISKASIFKSSLKNTNFTKSNCQNAVFDYCSLKWVNFSGADLRGAKFIQCDIEGIVFAEETLVAGKDEHEQHKIVNNFIRIYSILKKKHRSFFNTKNTLLEQLSKKEIIAEKMFLITVYAQNNTKGSAAYALQLAHKNINDMSSGIDSLTKDLYQRLYTQSPFRFFSIAGATVRRDRKQRKMRAIKKELENTRGMQLCA